MERASIPPEVLFQQLNLAPTPVLPVHSDARWPFENIDKSERCEKFDHIWPAPPTAINNLRHRPTKIAPKLEISMI
jgi:hypothetical protein